MYVCTPLPGDSSRKKAFWIDTYPILTGSLHTSITTIDQELTHSATAAIAALLFIPGGILIHTYMYKKKTLRWKKKISLVPTQKEF